MTIKVKTTTTNGYHVATIDSSGYPHVYETFSQATTSARTWPIILPNDMHKYSRVEVIISGEPLATSGSVPIMFQNQSGTNLTCFVQGWECWTNNMNFINRQQDKICDNQIINAQSIFYDIVLYPTGNSINYTPFTCHAYGGDYGAGTASTQNWTGRCLTSSSSIRKIVISLPAMTGFKFKTLYED